MSPEKNCSTSTTITTHASRMNCRKLQFVSRWDRPSTSANLSIFLSDTQKRQNPKQNKTKRNEAKPQKKEAKKEQKTLLQNNNNNKNTQIELCNNNYDSNTKFTDCIQIALNNDCCALIQNAKHSRTPSIYPSIHTYIHTVSILSSPKSLNPKP